MICRRCLEAADGADDRPRAEEEKEVLSTLAREPTEASTGIAVDRVIALDDGSDPTVRILSTRKNTLVQIGEP